MPSAGSRSSRPPVNWCEPGVPDYTPGRIRTELVVRFPTFAAGDPSNWHCERDLVPSALPERSLPLPRVRGAMMETFFVRKQLFVGAVIFGYLMLALMLFRAQGRT